MRKTRVSIVVLVAAFMVSPAVVAENGSGGRFGQQNLETFLEARAEVLNVQKEYSSRLQSVEDDQEVADLQAEVREKMVMVVQDAGLSVDEFNRIAQAAQNDPDVAAKLESLADQE